MIPANQLAAMRADLNRTLVDTCTLKATTGSPRSLQVVASNVPCRMKLQKPGQAQAFDELGMPIALYQFDLPYNTVIAKDYQIVFNGHTYEVYDVMDDHSPLVFVSAFARRVKTS